MRRLGLGVAAPGDHCEGYHRVQDQRSCFGLGEVTVTLNYPQ
jgi:hypothetical protein